MVPCTRDGEQHYWVEDRRLVGGCDAILQLKLPKMVVKMLCHRHSFVLVYGSLVTPQLFCYTVGTTTNAKGYWAMAMRKTQALIVTMNCVCDRDVPSSKNPPMVMER